MPIEVPDRFINQSLYEVLGVESNVSKSLLKKAYLKSALKYHPDHNQSVHANAEFAFLAKAHEILSDEEKRSSYDESGEIDDSDSNDRDDIINQSVNYWRTVFPVITKAQIDEYRNKYISSEEESDDIISAYQKYEGDLQSVFESVPFADANSVERIAQILNQRCRANLTAKQIQKLKRKLASMEADEEKQFNQLSSSATPEQRLLLDSAPNDMSALSNAIQTRKQQRESQYSNMIDTLTHKYVKQEEKQTKTRGKKSQRRTEEPTEEEFERIQANLLKKRKN